MYKFHGQRNEKRIFVLLLLWPLLLFSCLPTISCQRSAPTAESLVRALLQSEPNLPDGILYRWDAPEGADDFIPDEMLPATFGFPTDYDGLEQVALFLPTRYTLTEYAVFLCKTSFDAEDTAMRCRGRLRMLRENAATVAPLCGLTPEAYGAQLDSGMVLIAGRYVLYALGRDTAQSKKVFLSAVPFTYTTR